MADKAGSAFQILVFLAHNRDFAHCSGQLSQRAVVAWRRYRLAISTFFWDQNLAHPAGKLLFWLESDHTKPDYYGIFGQKEK